MSTAVSAPRHTKVVIIGSGPAGYTAAVYAARAMLKPILIQGIQPGGQLTVTTDVENYPGFAEVVQGPWLMEEMQAQAEHVGTRMVWDQIVDIDLSRRPFRAVGDGGEGLSPDRLRELVRRHSRADHASTSGAGLGLAIVDRIMAAHGARLTTDPAARELSLHFPNT